MTYELPEVRESVILVLEYMFGTLELTCFHDLGPEELHHFVCDGRPLFSMMVTERAKERAR